ncbi:MAG TPA: tRNA/rRNA methyltransferase [Tenuifilaceae bacterium]|nr:tRNA/rRNA methyltransferase [Tenuifilaceae bacterium]
MRISYILVNNTVPENAGAAARALKTMGFNDLRFVNPCDYLCEKALMLAHGSHDILYNAKVYDSLSDALTGIDFSIATSSKQRWVRKNEINVNRLKSFIEDKGDKVQELAIVFGGEESGLSNEDIALCDVVSSIPLANSYPSLNLAQAVMIYSYSLSGVGVGNVEGENGKDYKHVAYKPLKEKVINVLNGIGLPPETLIHGRVLERLANANEQDINLLHSITTKIIERMEGTLDK